MNNEHNPFRLDELPPDSALRQLPFTVPEGYFEQLPTRVSARVTRRPTPSFSVSWSWQRTVASLAGASLIAVLVWQTLPQRQESLGNETLAGVSNEVITAYLDEQGIDPYELADNQQVHSSLGNDTTAIQYLDVRPADIKQHIEEQTATESKNLGS